jgi:hypothetical protein
MEPFVFAGNRRRWKYLRPIVGTTLIGAALWLVALCWVLLKSPSLPSLGLGAPRPTILARLGSGVTHSPRLTSRWVVR